jgi:hypothetical protein
MKKIITLCLVISCQVLAQWSNDPTINTPICLASSYQDRPQIVSDGSGGAIITWLDNRNPPLNSNGDIYAQRIGADGYVKWTTDGVGVCNNSITQNRPQIISDGSGGAIIVWEDLRNNINANDIYAQRIDSNGNPLWTINGVPVCTATGGQDRPMIETDGQGGAIITWYDKRNSNFSFNIYAQRIDPNGNPLWDVNGISICPATSNQIDPKIISDRSGGAIIMWIDNRTNVNENDVYAQRITAGGTLKWSTSGLAVCAIYRRQQIASIAPDGNGGAIIAWTDDRDTVSTPRTSDVYIQRVDSSGNRLWASDGVPISIGAGNQKAPEIFSFGDGGAIIAWDDTRNGSNNRDIYAQRVDPSGSIMWSTNGIPICNAVNDQDHMRLISDRTFGVIISWEDEREGGNNRHVYAQRVNANGNIQWIDNGVAISNAPGYKSFSQILPLGTGDAIITWGDERSGGSDNRNIFAQQLNGNGELGVVTDVEYEQPAVTDFELQQNYPNPFNPTTKISWQSPVSNWQTLKIYDLLGREVAILVDEYKPAGVYEVEFNATGLSSGVYFYKLIAGSFLETKKMILMR